MSSFSAIFLPFLYRYSHQNGHFALLCSAIFSFLQMVVFIVYSQLHCLESLYLSRLKYFLVHFTYRTKQGISETEELLVGLTLIDGVWSWKDKSAMDYHHWEDSNHHTAPPTGLECGVIQGGHFKPVSCLQQYSYVCRCSLGTAVH